MSVLHPFKAWRPNAAYISEIASVPYDVINSSEAKLLARDKPHSFLHVIRPEIDLPDSTDIHADEVYEKGAENLHKVLHSGYMTQDEQPSIYLYRLIMNGRSQIGIFGCVSVDDYDYNVILKHELTRPDKEDDRTRHIATQKAHAEPVMMTFKDDEYIQNTIDQTLKLNPTYDFLAEDNVQHTIWKVENTKGLIEHFKGISNLYIADGHHRCKSASRVAELVKQGKLDTKNDEYAYFPAVLFPMSHMKILAYNRIVTEAPHNIIELLETSCTRVSPSVKAPSNKTEFSVYYDGNWHTFKLPSSAKQSVAASLDVAVLSEFVLEPFFDIQDQRRDPRIAFVGGIRGTEELEKLVDSGNAKIAFSMFPTSIEELIAVSDAGELMPPKSTWFEPKLRSGLLIHTF